MTCKILGYVIAKNSWPTLGLSLVHAFRMGCQHVIVVNHQSTDATSSQLEKFKSLWQDRLTIINLDLKPFLQETTKKIILGGFDSDLYDWIYVFDSDEFLLTQSEQSLADILQSIPENVDAVRYQIDQWVVPQDLDDLDVDQYIRIKQRAYPHNLSQQSTELMRKKLIAGNINYFDIEFPSKVIVRGRFHRKLSAGAHFISSVTEIKEKMLSSQIIRCAHLPFLSKRHLANKAMHGKNEIESGFSLDHSWQNKVLYQLNLAGQLDSFWQRHSVSKLNQPAVSAGYPTLIEDDALAVAVYDTINEFKKIITIDKCQNQIKTLTKFHEVRLKNIISKVWLADNEYKNQINEYKNQINEYNNQINEHKNQINEYNNQINEILNSTSWKVSLPIRIIGNFFRQITIFAKFFGGILNELKSKMIDK